MKQSMIGQGPVHINAPFEEPLYETVSELSVPVTVIASAKCRSLSEDEVRVCYDLE
jgi:2-succinyl-5-enolpyruvyl-6-hydroxy-3-cyclohexene-1-carboxylate synthase